MVHTSVPGLPRRCQEERCCRQTPPSPVSKPSGRRYGPNNRKTDAWGSGLRRVPQKCRFFPSREARIDDTSQSMEHGGGFSFSEGPGTTPNVGINTRSKSLSIAAFSRISQESDASTHNKWRMPGRTRQGPSCVRSKSPRRGEGPLDLSVSGLAAVVDPEMCHSLLRALSVSRSLKDSRLSSPHVPVVFSYYTHKLSQL